MDILIGTARRSSSRSDEDLRDLRSLIEEAKKRGQQLDQRRPEDFTNPAMEQLITANQQRLMFIDDVTETIDKRSRLYTELADELRGTLQAQRAQVEATLDTHERSYEQWQQDALIAYYQTGEEADPNEVITVNRPDSDDDWMPSWWPF